MTEYIEVKRPHKKELRVGMLVEVTKGEYIHRGFIEQFKGTNTPRGVLVRLDNGIEGRVLRVITKEELKRENFIFYNKLLFTRPLFSIFDNERRKYAYTYSRSGHKYAFVFHKKEDADQFLEQLLLIHPDKHWTVRNIPFKKSMVDVFLLAGAEGLLIDNERSIRLKTLKKFEERVTG